MSVVIVAGLEGLIWSETRWCAAQGHDVVGISNNIRAYFFGAQASTDWVHNCLEYQFARYTYETADIRGRAAIFRIFERYREDICLVVHTAAQPFRNWAAREPLTDFTVNALGTLTMLEATRQFCPEAVLIFTSQNKVYGDTPNCLPLIEQNTPSNVSRFRSHPPDWNLTCNVPLILREIYENHCSRWSTFAPVVHA